MVWRAQTSLARMTTQLVFWLSPHTLEHGLTNYGDFILVGNVVHMGMNFGTAVYVLVLSQQ